MNKILQDIQELIRKNMAGHLPEVSSDELEDDGNAPYQDMVSRK